MRTFKKLFSSLLAVLMMLQVFAPMAVSAATTTSVSGYGGDNQTFTVVTQPKKKLLETKPSITIKQEKGIRSKNGRTKECFGAWLISVKDENGKMLLNLKKFSSGSKKITLEPGKTYTVTMAWDITADSIASLSLGMFDLEPRWSVDKMSKIVSCE